MWINSQHPAAYTKQVPTYRTFVPKSSCKPSCMSLLHSGNKEEDELFGEFINKWQKESSECIPLFEVGLPEMIRGRAWQIVTRSIELLEQNTGEYNHLLAQEDSEHFQNICMDTERTLPNLPNFDTRRQQQVNNVLKAYSIKDTTMGYSQGMNYVVAAITYTMPEENAFWFLMRIMKGYSLERIYPSSTCVMHECFVKFDKLLQLYTPDVYKHLTMEIKVSPSLYLQQWFQTFFLYSQRLDLSLRVLDLFVIRKIEALFCVSVAIIALSEETLLNASFIEAITHLKTLDENLLPTDNILDKAASYPDLLNQLLELDRQSQLLDDPDAEGCLIA